MSWEAPSGLDEAKRTVERLWADRANGRWAQLEALLNAWAFEAKPAVVAALAERIVALQTQRAERPDSVISLSGFVAGRRRPDHRARGGR